MKLPIELSKQANADIQEILEYHTAIFPSLGEQFLTDLSDSTDDIAAFPLAWTEIGAKVLRRKLLKQFPYAIYYEINLKKIFILRVFHTRRRPGSWR